MNETPRILPIQPQVTTIATNIMQTTQTPLDQKVVLVNEEKQVAVRRNKQKKDEVTISEQQKLALKERPSIETLRQLQVLLLFSQFYKEGIEQTSQMLVQFFSDLTSPKKKNQELNLEWQTQQKNCQEKNYKIEKHQKALLEKVPSFLTFADGDWSITLNHQIIYHLRSLTKIQNSFSFFDLPDTNQYEDKLNEKQHSLIKLELQIKENVESAREQQAYQNNQNKQYKKLKPNQAPLEKEFDYWKKFNKNKSKEYSFVQATLYQMSLLHPLKRKQHEYQAFLIREKILREELMEAEKAEAMLSTKYQKLTNQLQQIEKSLQEEIEKAEQLKRNLIVLNEQFQKEEKEQQILQKKYTLFFNQATNELQNKMKQMLENLTQNNQKNCIVETALLEELENTLILFKNQLKNQQEQKKIKQLEKIQALLTKEQAATILSQANAGVDNVQQLLEEID